MPDAQHAVVFAFTIGIMVGLGAAHLINVYVVDAFHPRNNKQYTPPLNDWRGSGLRLDGNSDIEIKDCTVIGDAPLYGPSELTLMEGSNDARADD